MSEYPLVAVEWLDSGMSMGTEWKSLEQLVSDADAVDSMVVTTVGMLIHEDDEHLLVAQSHDEHNDHYMNVQTIFVPCVMHRREVT